MKTYSYRYGKIDVIVEWNDRSASVYFRTDAGNQISISDVRWRPDDEPLFSGENPEQYANERIEEWLEVYADTC